MYKVLVAFTDLDDCERRYSVGDTYPREGYTPTERRVKALASSANKLGTAVIEYVEGEKFETVEQPEPKVVKVEKKRRKK